MPRRRNNPRDEMTLDEFAEIIDDGNKISMVKYIICKDYLKNNYWEMSKKTDTKHTCSICLEDICCKSCFTVLSCGHPYHAGCLMKWPGACPLCKS